MKEIGNKYSFWSKKVFHMVDEAAAEQIFLEVCQSKELHQTKIRVYDKGKFQEKYFRQNEKSEIEVASKTNYLLIADS